MKETFYLTFVLYSKTNVYFSKAGAKIWLHPKQFFLFKLSKPQIKLFKQIYFPLQYLSNGGWATFPAFRPRCLSDTK